MSTVHELKTWPAYFERLLSGEKTFEVRKDDRGFQAGDELLLREFDPAKCRLRDGCLPTRCPAYTGRELRFTAGFVYRQGAGLDCGPYVVLSLLPAPVPDWERYLLEGQANNQGEQLRSLCASVDRIRGAAGVGSDTDIEDLVDAVATLRGAEEVRYVAWQHIVANLSRELAEARAEVVRLGQELEQWTSSGVVVSGPLTGTVGLVDDFLIQDGARG
jgi:hypothetical protein